MGISYRSSDEEADKVFRQYEKVSGSQPVVIKDDLKVFDIRWKSDTVGYKLVRTFLESIRINFLIPGWRGQAGVTHDCICYSQRKQKWLGE